MKFATMATELTEMGFPLDSVISAVGSTNMNKEEAVQQLLDLEKPSHFVPSSSRHIINPRQPRGNLLDTLAEKAMKKGRRERKSHL